MQDCRTLLISGALALASAALGGISRQDPPAAHVRLSGVTHPLWIVPDKVAVRLDPARGGTQAADALESFRAPHAAPPKPLGFGRGWVLLEIPPVTDLVDHHERLAAIAATAPVVEVVPVFRSTDDPRATVIVGDRVLARFHPGTDEAAAASEVERVGGSLVQWKDGLAIIACPAVLAFAVAERLAALPGVRWAHPDLIAAREPHGRALDSLYWRQWYLENLGQLEATPGVDINIREAWAITRGSPSVAIGVYDDGVESAHPEFSAPGKIVNPWAVIAGVPDGNPQNALNKHGIAVAGIAVAESSPTLGISGVAPGCTLTPVFGVYDSPDSGIAAGFDYFREKGTAVVVNSWGYLDESYLPDVLAEALDRVTTEGRNGRGAVVVFASGNSNRATTSRLLAHPGVIGVGAVADSGRKTAYSSGGRDLDVVAPSGGFVPGFWPPDGQRTPGILTTDRRGIEGYALGSPGNPGGRWVLGLNDTDGTWRLVVGQGFSSGGTLHSFRVRFLSRDGREYVRERFPAHVFPATGSVASYIHDFTVPSLGPLQAWEVEVDLEQVTGAAMSISLERVGVRRGLLTYNEYMGPPPRPLRYSGFLAAQNGEWQDADLFGDYFAAFGGTSAAAPQVAGVAALMLSANPILTAAEVEEILRATARKINLEDGYYNAAGHSPYYGYGLVDAGAAVREALRRLGEIPGAESTGILVR